LFTTVSLSNRSYLLELLGTAAANVRVVHSGIDVSTFTPRERDRGTGSTVVFTSGPLVSRKGFDVLFQALLLLGGAKPDVRVAIAGDGPQRARLEELAVKLHLSDRVSFLGDISREDIKTHLAAAGVFALPCREALRGDRDAIPIALMEAMACAVPVVSTRFSGIPELVEHQRTGLLVDPDDPVDLAAAIVQLLDDQPLRRKLQENARKHVETGFDLSKSADELARLIEESVARSRRHRGMSAGDEPAAAPIVDVGESTVDATV
jgi:glycosyltransferase involved in cell wall biosynthesis